MGTKTGIGWCDSTNNGMMGCDGCELWTGKVRTCYAGILVGRYAGLKGWPASFDVPEVFEGRIEKACKWPDLTGQARPEKPWLDGYPRTIFLDDLGDSFTESLPIDWLMPHIPAMAASKHIWMFLTKRPRRMRQFFELLGYIPQNFWLGVSVTDTPTMKRIDDLAEIKGAAVYFASVEPFLGGMSFAPYLGLGFNGRFYERTGERKLDWLILGGESGSNRKTELTWMWAATRQAQRAEARVFIKQLGSAHAENGKGEDWTTWPDALKVRQMPEVSYVQDARYAGVGV